MKLTWGENSESNVSFNPLRILSWTSIVVESWLFVFHFSVKVVPYSANLYFVSKLPSTLPESVFDEPPYQKRIIQTWFDSYRAEIKISHSFNIIYVVYSYLRWNLLHLRFLSSILISLGWNGSLCQRHLGHFFPNHHKLLEPFWMFIDDWYHQIVLTRERYCAI